MNVLTPLASALTQAGLRSPALHQRRIHMGVVGWHLINEERLRREREQAVKRRRAGNRKQRRSKKS